MILVNLIGRLGNDPEVKTAANGNQFLTFRMAVEESYDTQAKESKTAWFSVTWFCDKVENKAQIFKKGSLVHLIGNETLRLYTDRNGQTQIGRDVRAHFMEFVPSSKSTTQDTQTPQVNVAPTAIPTPSISVSVVPQTSTATSVDATDDLPF